MPTISQDHGVPPRAKIDRFRKLRRMATNAGAAPAERAVAQRQLSKLRARFPGIEQWAAVDVDLGNLPPPPPPGTTPPYAPGPGPALRGVFDFARAVWEGVSVRRMVYDMAEQTVGVEVVRTHGGGMRFIVNVKPEALGAVARMGPEARGLFAEAIANHVHDAAANTLA
jgi:hypothetical protein